jgi:hypothetical protein
MKIRFAINLELRQKVQQLLINCSNQARPEEGFRCQDLMFNLAQGKNPEIYLLLSSSIEQDGNDHRRIRRFFTNWSGTELTAKP